ncbi:hypothetical protein D1007_46590 [Hordeum vulgare]|nr:hypothetical protein D1007_46590 [Hordeum vulgare]
MEKASAKLWDMYEESKAARATDNLESSFLIYNLIEEKNKLEENCENLYGDVNALLDQQQRAMDSVEEKNLKDNTILQQKYDILKNLTAAQGKVIRNLKNTHLKEKERLTEERHKLQHHISELQKSKEKNEGEDSGGEGHLRLGAGALVVDLLVDVVDVLLTLLAEAFEALLGRVVGLLSLLAGALEVPAAVAEALLAGGVGGAPGGAPIDEAATVAFLVGAARDEDAPTDVVPSCIVFDCLA